MKRILFYVFSLLAFCSRIISSSLYGKLIVLAHKTQGVRFLGFPSYIDYSAHLDASGGLTICGDVVISTKVIVLTHDWSFLKRKVTKENYSAFRPVYIGSNSFIGAGAIILPGTIVGKSCIIGAVVKGEIEDFSIVAGNPVRKIGDTRNL